MTQLLSNGGADLRILARIPGSARDQVELSDYSVKGGVLLIMCGS